MVAIATCLIFALGAKRGAGRQDEDPRLRRDPSSGKTLKAKPSQIIWTGDGHRRVAAAAARPASTPSSGGLHWGQWTATVGEGSGANWLNDCIPFCADGKFTPFNANFTAYRPRVISGFKVFTRLKVVYTGDVPRGFKRTEVYTLGHRGKQFFWNFPV